MTYFDPRIQLPKDRIEQAAEDRMIYDRTLDLIRRQKSHGFPEPLKATVSMALYMAKAIRLDPADVQEDINQAWAKGRVGSRPRA